MKHRSDKELLIILRDNIHKLRTGLCFLATQLCWEKILTEDEEFRIQWYISIHRPKAGKYEKYYFWPPRLQEPRIEWIHKQLEK